MSPQGDETNDIDDDSGHDADQNEEGEERLFVKRQLGWVRFRFIWRLGWRHFRVAAGLVHVEMFLKGVLHITKFMSTGGSRGFKHQKEALRRRIYSSSHVILNPQRPKGVREPRLVFYCIYWRYLATVYAGPNFVPIFWKNLADLNKKGYFQLWLDCTKHFLRFSKEKMCQVWICETFIQFPHDIRY